MHSTIPYVFIGTKRECFELLNEAGIKKVGKTYKALIDLNKKTGSDDPVFLYPYSYDITGM